MIGGVLLTNSGNNQSAAAAVPAGVLHKPDSHTLTEAPVDKVTVVEFLDYQCPACAAYYQNVIQSVEQDYQGQITFVVRNFPLDMHNGEKFEPTGESFQDVANQFRGELDKELGR